VGGGVYIHRGALFSKGEVNRLLEIHKARKPQMPLPNEAQTYTQGLSREVDATYKAYRAGELNGDVRLYSAFRAQARNVIWWKLNREDEALAHDIARRAFMAMDTFRCKCRVSTWSHRVAINEVKRAFKERVEALNRVPIDLIGEDEDNDVVRLKELEAEQIDQDAVLDMERLRGTLPWEQNEVVSRVLEGYSLEEVAQRAGDPLGTVRSRYRLAKNKMAQRGRTEGRR
jgi:RNA polymerase sigma factor (sigma-70 family)